jgi:hypothetical protein
VKVKEEARSKRLKMYVGFEREEAHAINQKVEKTAAEREKDKFPFEARL